MCRPGGRGGPILPQASGLGDEGRSLQSGPGKAAGASLSLARDADLRIQQDAVSLLGSARLVLGIISSVEDAMRYSPSPLMPFRVLGECFSSSVTCWQAWVNIQGVLGEAGAGC